jgi:hypothetical protein
MPAQLIVHCPDLLEKVRSFADRTNQRTAFENKLEDLTRYKRDGWTVDLYEDFAPYSFFWVEYEPATKQRGLIGGLIYHGAHDGGGNGEAPTISVNLTPCTGWSIHT